MDFEVLTKKKLHFLAQQFFIISLDCLLLDLGAAVENNDEGKDGEKNDHDYFPFFEKNVCLG